MVPVDFRETERLAREICALPNKFSGKHGKFTGAEKDCSLFSNSLMVEMTNDPYGEWLLSSGATGVSSLQSVSVKREPVAEAEPLQPPPLKRKTLEMTLMCSVCGLVPPEVCCRECNSLKVCAFCDFQVHKTIAVTHTAREPIGQVQEQDPAPKAKRANNGARPGANKTRQHVSLDDTILQFFKTEEFAKVVKQDKATKLSSVTSASVGFLPAANTSVGGFLPSANASVCGFLPSASESTCGFLPPTGMSGGALPVTGMSSGGLPPTGMSSGGLPPTGMSSGGLISRNDSFVGTFLGRNDSIGRLLDRNDSVGAEENLQGFMELPLLEPWPGTKGAQNKWRAALLAKQKAAAKSQKAAENAAHKEASALAARNKSTFDNHSENQLTKARVAAKAKVDKAAAAEQKKEADAALMLPRPRPTDFVFLLAQMDTDMVFKLRTARRAAYSRFQFKREQQRLNPKVRYESRKKIADCRPRVKGRFVKTEELVTATHEWKRVGPDNEWKRVSRLAENIAETETSKEIPATSSP